MPEGVKIYVVTGGTETWHMNDPKTYRDYVKDLLYPKTLDSDLTPAENAQIDNMAGDLLSKYRTNISGLQFWEVVSDGTVNRMVNRQTYIGQYMTDPKFFARIIDYGAPEDPDCKYDLIIWDHGGGITGYGADDILSQYKNDHKGEDLSHLPDTTFTLEQMRQAIADSDYIKNGGKFDFIGFDACLMASYEVASTLKDLSHYYIGSEEIEPGAGWDYMALFTALSENPGMSTRDLGSKIIDSFLEQYKGNNESTLSLVDMTGVDELDDAVSNFAEILLKELEVNEYDSSIYLQIINNVGKKAHFSNRNGYYTSNYLDLKRLVSIFASNDLGFSKELRNASEEVLNRLDECVLYNKWLEKDVENGGLSIYFPLAAYYEVDSEKPGYSYYNNTASKAVKIYNESDINEEYKRAVARFALLSIAGKMVGQDWQDLKINDSKTIVSKIKSDLDWNEHWRLLYEAAKVDESDTNDPTLKDFEKILADRITRNDITVTKPDSQENPAMVEVAKPQSMAVGDVVEVKVELFDKDNNYIGSLGNTSQYSKYEKYEDDKAVYSINPYDMLWYLLNGQICSMYITTEYDDGSYQGYIPVCYWADAQSASNLDMKDGESRKEYLKRAAKEGKVSTVYLNVLSDKNGENFEVMSYSSVDASDGTVNAADTNLSGIANRYYELLGGMDNFYKIETPAVFSLGTIYYEEKEKLNVTKDYISDVGQSYYISDTYGNTYYLTDDNLGGEGKGLSNYYKSIPYTDEDGKPIDPMTWEKSLLKAEEVREAAAQEAANASEGGNSTSTALDQEAVAAKSTDVAAEETEKEIVTETSDLTAETVTKNAEPASEEALKEVKEEVTDEEAAKEVTDEEVAEEVTEEEPTEEVTDEEPAEEVVDEEAAEEVTEEEAAEEVTDEEPAKEVTEEPAKEEPAEEVVEEPAEEVAEVTVEKSAEEIAEEPVAKPEAEEKGEEKGEETPEKIEEQIPEALPLETNTEVTTEDD